MSRAWPRPASVALLPALVVVLLAVLPREVAAQELKVLHLEDYGQWSSITQVALSPDGRWMTFAYQPNDGDGTLFIRDLENLGMSPVEMGTNGTGPVFSEDSRWLAFFTTPPEEEEAERSGEQRQPVPRTFHLLNILTEERIEMENAASIAFSEDSRWLAVHKTRPEAGGGGSSAPAGRGGRGGGRGGPGGGGEGDNDDQPRGADLILRDLSTGTVSNVGNVAEYAFNDTGAMLAYLVDAQDKVGNGLYLMEVGSGRITPVSTGQYLYAQLVWNEEGTALAVLRGDKGEGMVQRDNVLLAYPAIDSPGGGAAGSAAVTYDPSADASFPEGFVLSELSAPQWSEDGERIFLGIKEQEEELDESDEPRANVDVWHWKDDRVQSIQMVQASRDRRATYLSVLNLGNSRFLRLADDDMQRVQLTDNGRWAVGFDDSPYRMDPASSNNRSDVYRVDPTSGGRTPIATALINDMGTSPDSRWFLFWQDQQVQGWNLDTGNTVNLTETAGVDFENKEFDRPVEKSTYGVGGWSTDGGSVFLNHKYDVWQVPLDGGEALNLTGGMGDRDSIRFRVVDLNTEDDGIDLGEPVLLSAYGEWTKRSGHFRARAGRDPEELIWEDEMIGAGGRGSPGVRKAKNADRIVYTRQTFEQFPDYWTSDTRFRRPRKVTDANPHQAEYAWGSRVLVDYTDDRGNDLQATLALPAGYTEGERYPMLIYFYEKMSQRHHQYSMPVYDDRPHMSTYASNGYLVLMPDIVFDVGYPGSSSLDDVTAAAEKVIELGYADPGRICLQGHSWGGYESSFIVTQTDMFACVVTGAPLTNLISMYNINYKRTGSPNGPILEWSQGRMDTSPYHDFELYVSQSPLHHVANITTPFMILHGTDDGAVDWNQGLEYYNAARRMGKEVILLSYPGEPHHLGKEENQKDFQIRMKQYFDYYMKDVPAPEWLREGVPFLKKERIGPKDGVGGS